MFDPSALGQQPSLPAAREVRRALATLDHALSTLRTTQMLDVDPLVQSYLALSPRGHPFAESPTVDVGFLGRTLSLLGDPTALRAHRFVLSTTRAPVPPQVRADGSTLELFLEESSHAPADVLALALGLVVERAKAKRILGDMPELSADLTARLLGVTTEALAQTFGSLENAWSAFKALVSTSGRATVHCIPPRAPPARAVSPGLQKDAFTGDGHVFIVAGASRRMHDLLSPFVRRLEVPLSALAGTPDDDALYATLPLLVAEDPLIEDERRVVEESDGIFADDDLLIVRARSLDVNLVDARARVAVRELALADSTIVLVPEAPVSLVAALTDFGPRTRAVILLAEGFVPTGAPWFPDVIAGPFSHHAIENPLAPASNDAVARVAFAVPGLGLAPSSAPGVHERAVCATGISEMADVVVNMRAQGGLHRTCRTAAAVVFPGDDDAHTKLALLCLDKMARTTRA
jgi:hypothetical protein